MSIETVEIRAFSGPSVVEINGSDQPAIVEINQGPAGAAGAAGPNSVTSDTTSDGTANLSLSNVTTATAEVTGTLTANHIHGNLAGSVYAHVRAGEALAKGDPVYVSGSHGTGANLIAVVSKADASDALKMPAVGIMDAAVANNANGHMVITGTITDINTAAYSVNAELYVAEGGGFTATPPLQRAQPVARVERSNTNNGALIVKVNGLSAYDNTGNTLVRRNPNGDATFSAIQFPSYGVGSTELGVNNDGSIESNPSIVLPGASGTLALTNNLSGVVGIAYGGTNATSVSDARANLSLGPSGTITTSQPLSVTQTWNASAVTFKGIDVNVTDTASASGSLLMDLRVGGVSRFSVDKDGKVLFSGPQLTLGRNTISFLGNDPTFSGNYKLHLTNSAANTVHAVASLSIGDIGTPNNFAFRLWNTSSQEQDGVTLRIGRGTYLTAEASNSFAQRNGLSAQESRIYGTYSSSGANYERLTLKATGTAFQIGTEKLGTGVARPLEFQTDGTTRMTIGATGNVGIGTTNPLTKLHIQQTAQSATREGFFQFTLSDAGNDTFQIANGTSIDGRFIPTFAGYVDSTNSRESINLAGLVSASNDSSNSSIAGAVNIYAARTNSSSNPINGTFSSLVNRSIFSVAHSSDFSIEQNFAIIVRPNGRVLFPSDEKIGISTNSPASKLTVANGDAEVNDSASGLILKSPDGTRYRIKVANGGTLTVTAV